MTATIVITIIVSVLTSFLAPLIFAGAASTFSFIFEHFTNPFRFTYVDDSGNGITNWFVDMVGADLLNIIVKIMISAGVVLAVFILAVNLFKLFASGISRRIDSPISLCIRAVMAIFLSYWIIDIVYEVAFPIFQWLLDKVNNITISSGETVMSAINSFYGITKSTPSSSFGLDANTSYMTDWKSAIEGLTSNATYDVLGGVLTTIIFIIFFFKSIISMFKLIAEMAERYLLVNVLTICSPMIMPTIISNGTIQVFVSWVQMMLANCLVLVFNSLGMIMLKMAFINVGIHCSAYGNNGISWTSAITSMIVYVALIKVVQKFDVYLAQLAFKIQAIGGDNKGMTVGGLLALGAKAQKNAADITNAGGLKNAVGEKVGNLVGVFNKNSGEKLKSGASTYRAERMQMSRDAGKKHISDLENNRIQNILKNGSVDQLTDLAKSVRKDNPQVAFEALDAVAKTTKDAVSAKTAAQMIMNDEVVVPDSDKYKTAFDYYKMAADKGDVEAEAEIGRMYLDNQGCDITDSAERITMGIEALENASERGNVQAMSTLGDYYSNNGNYEEAVEYYDKVLESKNVSTETREKIQIKQSEIAEKYGVISESKKARRAREVEEHLFGDIDSDKT